MPRLIDQTHSRTVQCKEANIQNGSMCTAVISNNMTRAEFRGSFKTGVDVVFVVVFNNCPSLELSISF